MINLNNKNCYPLLFAFFITLIISHNNYSYAENEETYKGLKIFSSVLEEIENNYVDTVVPEELIEKAIHGMLRGLDPHSSFLPPEAFEELQVDTKGAFGGIGIVISMKNNVLTVISPIDGTPAAKAGLKAEDIIIKVDGQSTKDMELWEAVKKMRGAKGTVVTITVLRPEEKEPLEFKLKRDVIPIYSVKHVSIKPGYGYIWVTNFRDNTTKDLENALIALQNEATPLKGLILDLRDNPGGLLTQAVDVCDLFLKEGIIVSIKGRHESPQNIFSAKPDEYLNNYPIVVLINGGSASASEIVAGALQDNKRALILGTTSFGKGSVQTVKPVKDGYGLKYTIARYYTPNGRSIQAQGIEPDIILKKRIIDMDPENYEETYIKEKDLTNHLEAEPKKNKKRIKKNKHSKLDPEDLLLDNQINRACEILISYDIFKNIAN